MMPELATTVTGWLFVASAAMLWLGWTLLPVRIGDFFAPEDFSRVHPRFHVWIWLYRVHLFGYIVAIMALVAYAAMGATSPSLSVVIWPAVAVCCAGLLVAVLAQAFYYHFGAWGALDVHDKPRAAAEELVEALKVPTEYVTCFVRFGRVFFGLGQLVLSIGFLFGGLMPTWVGVSGAVSGVAAMALTMGLPDHLSLYRFIFHFNALWLIAVGVILLRMG